MVYFVKTPWWLMKLYPGRIWRVDTDEKILYLTFDDGPHPSATTFVLDTLARYNAKATFFCIGRNVAGNRELYERILDEGHAVGNHTHDHLNGWKTNDGEYLDNIAEAAAQIDSRLFRPPYGKITRFQLRQLSAPRFRMKTIMWTILSGDFDPGISKERCSDNIVLHATPGSIIVFHDSEKAFERLGYALPVVLDYFSRKGFSFKPIMY